MIRYSLLSLLAFGVVLLAFRDWFKGLCGLIVLMAIIENPDMPKTMLGIQGLNPWNLCMLAVLMNAGLRWRVEHLSTRLPRAIGICLLLYVVVIVIGFCRLYMDPQGVREYAFLTGTAIPTGKDLVSEYLINTLKWFMPAYLLYKGCNSKERIYWALAAILAFYLLLAIQVLRWMPVTLIADGEALQERALRVLSREVGFHRVDLSMLLAGGSWACFLARELFTRPAIRGVLLCAAGIVFIGQAMTGGRMGYVTWLAIGLSLGWWKWRKLLLLVPIVIALVAVTLPAVTDRLQQGFKGGSIDNRSHQLGEYAEGTDNADLYTITAGRVVAWPYVLDRIRERPMVGYGRRAMQNIGISTQIMTELNESFPHPHNAYLQLVLDNGLIGAVPIALFYIFCVRIFKDMMTSKGNVLTVVTGTVALSLTLAQLVASFGSQTFYPREGMVSMLCAMFLALRIHEDVLLGQRRGGKISESFSDG